MNRTKTSTTTKQLPLAGVAAIACVGGDSSGASLALHRPHPALCPQWLQEGEDQRHPGEDAVVS